MQIAAQPWSGHAQNAQATTTFEIERIEPPAWRRAREVNLAEQI
jgi:hypothetical protein